MTLHDGFNLWMGKTLAELAIAGIIIAALVAIYLTLGVVIWVGGQIRLRRTLKQVRKAR